LWQRLVLLVGTTFQPKTSPNYLLISLCQTKTSSIK